MAERFVDPDVLRTVLSVAVPMWAHRMRTWTAGQVRTECEAAADLIAGSADALFRDPGKKADQRPAEVFNAAARAIAALSQLPGGVDFAGAHWCADHKACEDAARRAREEAHCG